MSPQTSDLRVSAFEPLLAPAVLRDRLPLSRAGEHAVSTSRREIEAVLTGQDDRLLVVVGPCSVHDPVAAMEYAHRLKPLADRHSDELLIVMRVYFEKPRSTGGWKGLINDPHLDGTHEVAEGLAMARRAAAGHRRARASRRLRVPGADQSALHRRRHQLGGHRRSHDREPDPSPAGLRHVHADRIQERHRRRRAGRGGWGDGGGPVPGLLRHRRRGPGMRGVHGRQRVRARDPAWRQERPELRQPSRWPRRWR